jgi:DNA primase large subunit
VFRGNAQERKIEMRKAKQKSFKSDVYKILNNTRLSESERLVAINALRDAEMIADAFGWLKEKFETVGHYFLKPSLKH